MDQTPVAETSDILSSPPLAAALARLRAAPRRLLLGVGVMLLTGLIGSRIFQTEAASSVGYRALGPIAAGELVGADQLEQIQLPTRLATDGLLTASELAKPGYASHAIASGEILFGSDLSSLSATEPVVALAFPAARLPVGLAAGSVVDLWQSSPDGSVGLTEQVRVVAVSSDSASGSVSLSLRVPAPALGQVLSAAATDELVAVGRQK